MRFQNSNIAKAKLGQANYQNTQTNFKKSSLSKRIIKNNANDLRRQQISRQNEVFMLETKLEDIKEQIVNKLCNYQRLICVDLESTNKIKNISEYAYITIKKYYFKEIDIKQCIQWLEGIDKKLTEIIEAWEHSNSQIL